MKQMKKLGWLCVSCLLMLHGCAAYHSRTILSHQYGSYCSKAKLCRLAKNVNEVGGVVFHFGDQVSVTIHAAELFSGERTVLNRQAETKLKHIAALFRCYQKIELAAVIYYPDPAEQDRARMRAIALQRYLSRLNSNTRILYTAVQRRSGDEVSTIDFSTRKLP